MSEKALSRLPVTKMNSFSPTRGLTGAKSSRSSPSQPQRGLVGAAAGAAAGGTRSGAGAATEPVGGGKADTMGCPVRGSMTIEGGGRGRGGRGVMVGDGVKVGVTVEVAVVGTAVGVCVAWEVAVGGAVGTPSVSALGGARSKQAVPAKASATAPIAIALGALKA